jgi:hypothetical protein
MMLKRYTINIYSLYNSFRRRVLISKYTLIIYIFNIILFILINLLQLNSTFDYKFNMSSFCYNSYKY